MFPTNELDRPVVKVVPTAHQTFEAEAPYVRRIDDFDPVITVVAAWNIH